MRTACVARAIEATTPGDLFGARGYLALTLAVSAIAHAVDAAHLAAPRDSIGVSART